MFPQDIWTLYGWYEVGSTSRVFKKENHLRDVQSSSRRSDITQSIGRIMRETKGKKNNPHIYDVHDPWSIFTAMYYKRTKVYRQGGFKIHGKVAEEKPTFPQGKCLFLNLNNY